MRCFSCHKLSVAIICPDCREKLLSPDIHRRKVGTLDVVSLFGYKSIEPLLLTKHTSIGYRVYRYFGKHFIAPFISKFADDIDVGIHLAGIDEKIDSGYSHTALLTHFVRHHMVKVSHSRLLASNRVSYAGKPLQYRLDNPRGFIYTGDKEHSVVLVDDIITTGTTIHEAYETLSREGIDVLFALTLADAKY